MRRLLLAAALLLAIPATAATPDENARVFDRAWERIERLYWDPDHRGVDWAAARRRWRAAAIAAPDTRTLYAATNAMLRELRDSHVFAEPPAARRFDDARRAGDAQAGFGIDTGDADDGWLVFAVRPDGPAARAGVQIGWRLVSIAGRPPDSDWHPARGEAATLLFRDETGAARRVELTAVLLPGLPERRARMLAGGVLLLRLDGFARGAGRWIEGEIAAASPRAVILDLRENGGGEAIEAARVAGRFFASKRTLLTRIERRRRLDVPILSARDQAWRGPLAVLIGRRSASAAEAVAALIDESGRGTTVGGRTAGALTGATLVTLPDGGLLSVAEADVRTAGGARIEGVGWPPRVAVTPSLADLRAGRDPVLARAVAVVGR